jgi:hypothetical protein
MKEELTAGQEALKPFPIDKLHPLLLSFDVAGRPTRFVDTVHVHFNLFRDYRTSRTEFLRGRDIVPAILTRFTERITRLVKKTSKGQCCPEFEGKPEIVDALSHPHEFCFFETP